ncbi:MAG: hypothetical protein HN790_17995 [Methylococcales bacterium]|jgi:hypothetical protein|nr:hypothetical protein [Methylococcales bacterium]
MVSWPAIIHYEGDDELSYVENEHDWLNNEVFHRGLYNQGDQLVDSEGQVYSIDYNTATEKLDVLNSYDKCMTSGRS